MIPGIAMVALLIAVGCLPAWSKDFRAWFARTTYFRAADRRKAVIGHNIAHFTIKHHGLRALRPNHALRLQTALDEARRRYGFWANPVDDFWYQPTQLAYRKPVLGRMRTIWLQNL